jgi:S-formylglutathione hydrolase FrmB
MKLFITIFCLLFTLAACAQSTGKVLEGKTVQSALLGRDVRYNIYLPADYATSERTYSVVYLLHGLGDDDTGWVQFGEVNRYADQAIASGDIPPMIIVMPDGAASFYINSYDGTTKYEDFFIKEFMPAIEKTYRIKTQKRYRGIAGLSMGGYGTLIYALKYPDLFAAAAPLSAAVIADEDMVGMPAENWNRVFAPLFGKNLTGKDRLTPAYYNNSPLKIVETKSKEELGKVRYWIDCGDDDFLINGNCLLKIALTRKGVPHEFRVREGAHTWTYWRTGITDALNFIGESFRQK